MRKKRLTIHPPTVLLLNLFITHPIFSAPISRESCYALSSKPSLIIQYKHKTSDLRTMSGLSSSELARLSVPGVSFTESRAMAWGAYIVFFEMNKNLRPQERILKETQPYCYTPESVTALITQIQKRNPDIANITPNLLHHLQDDFFSQPMQVPQPTLNQWDFLAAPGGVNITGAWAVTEGTSNVIIADMDNGITDNANLNSNILSGATFNNNGANITTGATQTCTACAGYYHGTFTAGTMVSTGNGSYGQTIYGMAPQAKVYPINIFTEFTSPTDCGGSAPCLSSYTSDELNAWGWLAGQSFPGLPTAPFVVAINQSFGSSPTNVPCGSTVQTAITTLINQNITIAGSAGNDDIDASGNNPNNCSGVISVAATYGPNGCRATYSNWGSTVAIAAPGGDETQLLSYNITCGTLIAANAGVCNTQEGSVGGGYLLGNGTSFAAPHVTGLVALMYAVNPTLNSTTVLSQLNAHATSFPLPAGGLCTALSTNGYGEYCVSPQTCGSGIINAAQAVSTLTSPTLNFSPTINITSITSNSANVSWSAASWSPSSTTAFIYTTNLNGTPVSNCTNISSTSCALSGLQAGAPYNVTISATDYRSIHTPVTSSTQSFTTTIATGAFTFNTLASTNYTVSAGTPAHVVYWITNSSGGTLTNLTFVPPRSIPATVSTNFSTCMNTYQKSFPNNTMCNLYVSFVAPSTPQTITLGPLTACGTVQSSNTSLCTTTTPTQQVTVNVISTPQVVALYSTGTGDTLRIFNATGAPSYTNYTLSSSKDFANNFLGKNMVGSPDGNTTYVAYSSGNQIGVYYNPNQSVSFFPANLSGPAGITMSPDGNYIFVANNGATGQGYTVSMVCANNTATGCTGGGTGSIAQSLTGATGAGYYDVLVSGDQSKAFVCALNANTLDVWNLTTIPATFVNSYPTGFGANAGPFSLTLNADGTQVWIASPADNSIVGFNIGSNTISSSKTVVGGAPVKVLFPPLGPSSNPFAYIIQSGNQTVALYDVYSGKSFLSLSLPFGSNPIKGSFSSDGQRLVIVNDNQTFTNVYPAANAITATVTVSGVSGTYDAYFNP